MILDFAVITVVHGERLRQAIGAASAEDVAEALEPLTAQVAILTAQVAALTAALAGKEDTLGFTPENVANKDTDGNLTANSDTKYASQKATKTYADLKLAKSGGTMTGDIVLSGGTEYGLMSNDTGSYIASHDPAGGIMKVLDGQVTYDIGAGVVQVGTAFKVSSGIQSANAMDCLVTDDSQYQRFGFDGGTGPMFQLFGDSHGLAGNSYFDTYNGTMHLRWNGTNTHFQMPGGAAVPNWEGWDVGNAPTDTTNATAWFRIQMDGADGYIPWHAA